VGEWRRGKRSAVLVNLLKLGNKFKFIGCYP